MVGRVLRGYPLLNCCFEVWSGCRQFGEASSTLTNKHNPRPKKSTTVRGPARMPKRMVQKPRLWLDSDCERCGRAFSTVPEMNFTWEIHARHFSAPLKEQVALKLSTVGPRYHRHSCPSFGISPGFLNSPSTLSCSYVERKVIRQGFLALFWTAKATDDWMVFWAHTRGPSPFMGAHVAAGLAQCRKGSLNI